MLCAGTTSMKFKGVQLRMQVLGLGVIRGLCFDLLTVGQTGNTHPTSGQASSEFIPILNLFISVYIQRKENIETLPRSYPSTLTLPNHPISPTILSTSHTGIEGSLRPLL